MVLRTVFWDVVDLPAHVHCLYGDDIRRDEVCLSRPVPLLHAPSDVRRGEY
ncbi:MAG: hypothetical protein PHN75_09595 [Syntrophales bacterium]|nr:hypothetical protein [Syntrophales bacterium]